MSYNDKLNNYLERLHINKKYKNIYTQSNNIKWVRKIINNYEINNIQNGGKVYEHKYLDLLFKFYIVDNDTSFSFTLHQKNNEDLIEYLIREVERLRIFSQRLQEENCKLADRLRIVKTN